jgi:hypothetical protein
MVTGPVGRQQRFVQFGTAGELPGGFVEEDLLATGCV